MKLHQLHDLYEMLIVKCDLERLQMELFITHFEIFQHLPAGNLQQPKNQSMQLAPQLIQSTNADQHIRVFYMPQCHYVLHTHCVQ